MSDPALALEIWAREHQGLLRLLNLVIDDLIQTTTIDEPALLPLNKALKDHLGEVDSIVGDVRVLTHREMKRALVKMQAAQKKSEEQPTVQ